MFKYIPIVIVELLLLVGAIYTLINPLSWVVGGFIVIAVSIHILSFIISRITNSGNLETCMKLVGLYHTVIIVPAILFVVARYMGIFFNNTNLFYFFL